MIIIHFNSEVKCANWHYLISILWQNYEICSSSAHSTPQEQEDEEVDEVSERQGFNPLTGLIQVIYLIKQLITYLISLIIDPTHAVGHLPPRGGRPHLRRDGHCKNISQPPKQIKVFLWLIQMKLIQRWRQHFSSSPLRLRWR